MGLLTLIMINILFQFFSSVDKESACNMEDVGSIPGQERFPGEGNRNPVQYSYLENSMDRGAWQPTAHGVTKSQTGLNN